MELSGDEAVGRRRLIDGARLGGLWRRRTDSETQEVLLRGVITTPPFDGFAVSETTIFSCETNQVKLLHHLLSGKELRGSPGRKVQPELPRPRQRAGATPS